MISHTTALATHRDCSTPSGCTVLIPLVWELSLAPRGTLPPLPDNERAHTNAADDKLDAPACGTTQFTRQWVTSDLECECASAAAGSCGCRLRYIPPPPRATAKALAEQRKTAAEELAAMVAVDAELPVGSNGGRSQGGMELPSSRSPSSTRRQRPNQTSRHQNPGGAFSWPNLGLSDWLQRLFRGG